MKTVLISIQPKWCELIASGKKLLEVRKTRPNIKTPFKCYIYCTLSGSNEFFKEDCDGDIAKWNKSKMALKKGKVIGEFVCDCIANYEAELWDDETYERIQEFYEPDDFAEYGEYEYKTVADNGDDFWKENMLCTYSCLTIEELRKYLGSGINEFYGWHISDLVIYDNPKELGEFYRWTDYDDSKKDKRPCSYCEYNAFDYSENCEYCSVDYDGEHCVHLKMKRPPQSWCYVERKEDEGK